jgi:hypothetical protein
MALRPQSGIFLPTDDTEYGTMDRKTLNKLREALKRARRSPQTSDDLEGLAKMAGRRMRPGSSHPMWISNFFPSHRPLPIERHGGNRPVPPYACKVILNGLEADLYAWEETTDDE